MKSTLLVLVSCFMISSAFAASKRQINDKATDLLISNLVKLQLRTEGGVTREQVIKHVLYKNTKLRSDCVYDKNDRLYNCETTALLVEPGEGESAMIFEYQLEGNAGELPTEFFFLSADVFTAG